MTMAVREALTSAVLVLSLALGASACSGGEEDPPAPGESSVPAQATEDATTFEIQTRTTIGKQVGKLDKGDPRKLSETITGIVQRWFNAAYVGGDYPRSDFHDAFPGFTPGARDRAQQDRLLMTNKGIGARVDDVTPTESRLWLDVLAVRKKAVGVTARFRLKFETSGDYERKVRVHGRLLLSRQEDGWKIFGYDVARGGRA